MKTLEILSGTDANEQSGFLYRYTGDTQPHPYVWVSTNEEKRLKESIRESLKRQNFFSVEFPEKNGRAYARKELGGDVIISFGPVSKIKQDFFLEST